MMEKEILEACHLQHINAGAYAAEGWLSSDSAPQLASTNPATEQPIAYINSATQQDFEAIIEQAQKTFLTWSQVPAPKRGEVIRKIAVLLRKNKDYLGSLISLEMGKIKAEGDG